MSISKPSTQTPTERRAAEAELRGLVTKHAPKHERLVSTMRRNLLERVPTAHEIVYEYDGFFVISYSPSEHGYEGVLAIRGSADGVELHLNRGNELPDPEKLLRGSGKQMRSISVDGAKTLTQPAVMRLIDEALARNPVPFARSGSGPITIKLTTAKKKASAKKASPKRKTATRK